MMNFKSISFSAALCWCVFVFCILLSVPSIAQAADYKVLSYDPAKAFNGTTLFADNSLEWSKGIVEVDMNGKVIWDYPVPKSLFGGKLGREIIVMDVEKLANGNILFVIREVGIYEVDRTGKVVWSHLDSGASHDADRLPNGNTLYVRGWVNKGDNHVVEIDPQGNTVWAWNGMAQFNKPPYQDVYEEGWIHVNAVTRLENGNTLISLRNFNLVVEVNHSGDIVWMCNLADKFSSRAVPHDPEVLPTGDVLVALTGMNIVAECRRSDGMPVPFWKHPDGGRIASIRDVNRLPNGNTLIVEANKITELSPEQKVVWQLWVPSIQVAGRSNLLKYLYKAQRIGMDGSISGH